MQDFPLLVEEPVYYCGYNSPKSYGGNSYFIRHPDGNWLIDSPKFVTLLARKLEALGGIAHIFLTHRDDVAKKPRRLGVGCPGTRVPSFGAWVGRRAQIVHIACQPLDARRTARAPVDGFM